MLRYKKNIRTVIIAVAVILLCLVCLIGTTLAIFTNNPSDGTIGIITTAGKIDIDIVDSNTEASLVGNTLEFYTSSERREILFEPGATFHTQGFKLKNSGNIPVNFRLSVSEDDDIDMEEFDRAFEVWISTDNTNLQDAQRLTKFIGRLEAGEKSAQTYYLFVKMKESAGNEFKGKVYTGIGVTVYATQGNVGVDD